MKIKIIPYSVYNRLFGRGLLGALQIDWAIPLVNTIDRNYDNERRDKRLIILVHIYTKKEN
jgi:hypothetical protein